MRLEKKATIVSISTALLLVIMKMTVGILSGSVAVLASAIDSLLDFSVSLFNFFALHTSEKETDEQFNYGRSKIEPIAAAVEGTIIIMSALFIAYSAIIKILHPAETLYLYESIGVMIASIVLTTALVGFLLYVAKKTNNMVIRADALHYKTDLLSNGAILAALLVMYFVDMPLIDPILGFIIAVYMIYSAYPIIKESILMLLDVALEEEDYKKVEAVLQKNRDINGYHFLKTRISADEIFISVHVVFNISISLYDAHKISDEIELAMQKLFPDNRVHSIIHLDPYDDSDINEDEH